MRDRVLFYLVEQRVTMNDIEMGAVVATGVILGGGVVSAATAARKASQDAKVGLVREQFRGWVLRLAECMKSIKRDRPWLYVAILAAHALVSGALFAGDVTTDVRATIELRAQRRGEWVWMAVFIALPVFIMWGGILQYVRDNYELRHPWRVLLPAALLGPVAVPLLDVLWLVLKVPVIGPVLQRRMSERFGNLMITYGAARTVVETFLESLPQLVIQIYIARASPDDLQLLVPSIVLSFLDFVWVFLNNVFFGFVDMWNMMFRSF